MDWSIASEGNRLGCCKHGNKLSWTIASNVNELMVLQSIKKTVVIKQQKKIMYYFTNSYTWRATVSPTTYLT